MTTLDYQENPTRSPTNRFFYRLNIIALYLIVALLLAAFYFEFARGELPCPLCNLQRVALCAMGFGVILNLKLGLTPRHYGAILLAAVAGFVFAGRQVLLHIIPGTGSYGSPFLGLNYYTWNAIIFFAAFVLTGLVLLSNAQFEPPRHRRLTGLALVAVILMIAVTAANAVTTFLECGFQICPDPPTSFELLDPSDAS
ncbi:disulfide bond formation protein B [Bauldia sp.]|uniref:disulfide bond formation protein B n=1 Tax=Bauldia sp. TaxID=2575872 RepID=UPI003BA95F4B